VNSAFDAENSSNPLPVLQFMIRSRDRSVFGDLRHTLGAHGYKVLMASAEISKASPAALLWAVRGR
jgi:hypothetical protein